MFNMSVIYRVLLLKKYSIHTLRRKCEKCIPQGEKVKFEPILLERWEAPPAWL